MKFLLDTHSLIWFALDDPRLSVRVHALIKDPNHEPIVSAATFLEIAIKVSIGKLPLDRPYRGLHRGVSDA